ncbi:MAG TPA: DNA-processing protein DprA [Candidatus Paceibacterota bacterium]|nr:DNA-processing protein DprA [Verrucomicrobiota bacterium]HOX02338.1 DNA-processing protein DprA [Verrucomicrobiota bacterium]HRZ93623.1 DNA-processing protein DprA [Candidatus Paceibacterota bacterium]
MDAREALIALNMIEHVGPIRLRQLLEAFGDGPSILAASRSRLERVPGLGPQAAESIAQWRQSVPLEAELRRIAEYGCQIVVGTDESYPPLLRQIYDPPIVLYVKGRLEERDRHAIALVGSRLTTPYGQDTARKLAAQLVHAGITVVSGGARGIDTSAHRGALHAQGRTIAVLGTGINRVVPPENAELFAQICAQGALVTQFPFNRPPDKQSFPIRNRIVAGMTLATVVVEATLTSGALITANLALDYGRQVMAVPGRIDSPRSKGCHDLIKKGAKLCESAEDILSEFEYLFPQAPPAASAAEASPVPPVEPSASGLTDAEQRVLSALGREEIHIDEIIRLTGLPTSVVAATLLGLEMRDLARQSPGKLFRRP